MRVPSKNWLEWSVFAVGVLCIGAVVAYLAFDALRSSGTPAEVIVRLGAAEARGGRQYVPVTLVNSGGAAASAVAVEVVLDRDGHPVDRAMVVVDLLPRSATRRAWAVFDSAAATGDRIRAGGIAFSGQ